MFSEPSKARSNSSHATIPALSSGSTPGRTFLIRTVVKCIEAHLDRAAGGRLWHGSAVRTATRMAARTPLTFGLPPYSDRRFWWARRCISPIRWT